MGFQPMGADHEARSRRASSEVANLYSQLNKNVYYNAIFIFIVVLKFE